MDHTAFTEELKTTISASHPLGVADFTQQVKLQLPAPCFELSFADPGAALATIATLIDAGLAMPDVLEPRRCETCGLWHARRVRR
jgi:hypothetical protein